MSKISVRVMKNLMKEKEIREIQAREQWSRLTPEEKKEVYRWKVETLDPVLEKLERSMTR